MATKIHNQEINLSICVQKLRGKEWHIRHLNTTKKEDTRKQREVIIGYEGAMMSMCKLAYVQWDPSC